MKLIAREESGKREFLVSRNANFETTFQTDFIDFQSIDFVADRFVVFVLQRQSY